VIENVEILTIGYPKNLIKLNFWSYIC